MLIAVTHNLGRAKSCADGIYIVLFIIYTLSLLKMSLLEYNWLIIRILQSFHVTVMSLLCHCCVTVMSLLACRL